MGVYVAWLESVVEKLQVPFFLGLFFFALLVRVFALEGKRRWFLMLWRREVRVWVYKRWNGRCFFGLRTLLTFDFLEKRRRRVMELVIQALG